MVIVTSKTAIVHIKKDMAERLGIQRMSLSRELNKMRANGLIEYNAKIITIKNYKLRYLII